MVYMINSTFHVNKFFTEKLEKCMNDTFGTITQTFIKNNMEKNNNRVLELVIFYETRHKNVTKYFIVLSCC